MNGDPWLNDLDPHLLTILEELRLGSDGQTENELKMHLGRSQQSRLLGELSTLISRRLIRCDGADRYWLVK